MPTFKYNKLVRDKIASMHENDGDDVKYKKLKGKELLSALCQKMHEEADEVDYALNTEHLIEELADVQELLDVICYAQGIEKTEIEEAGRKKVVKKGSFKEGIFIEQVTMPEDGRWVEYCRKDPDKYPEIKD